MVAELADRGSVVQRLRGGLRRRRIRLRRALFRIWYARDLDLMRGYQALRCDLENELRPAHQMYVSTVSDPVAAVSLELACVLLYLCRTTYPGTVLDLGSGFSSYVLRKYQLEQEQEPEARTCTVLSCDDNPYWLEKTASYLDSHQLSTAHLYDWDQLLAQHPQLDCDLILFDFSSPAHRVEVLPALANYLAANTLLCVDDIHKSRVRDAAERFIRAQGLRYTDLSSCTMDQYRRYSWLLFDASGRDGADRIRADQRSPD
jgi:predicted O-methyltransferase YrrM